MPKRPAHAEGASVALRLRTRLIEEQARRGWSDEGLAKRLEKYGITMAPATVWKIKSASPPRKVDLDEAYAFARAFGFDTLDDFLYDDFLRAEQASLELGIALGLPVSMASGAAKWIIEYLEASPGGLDEETRREYRDLHVVIAETMRRILAQDFDVMIAALRGESVTDELRDVADRNSVKKSGAVKGAARMSLQRAQDRGRQPEAPDRDDEGPDQLADLAESSVLLEQLVGEVRERFRDQAISRRADSGGEQ